MAVRIARAYDDPETGGVRVLVDRLWPRGVSKERLALDLWAKDVAPSDGLRRWYAHVPERYEGFARRYRAELKQTPASEALTQLSAIARRHTLVLVTATREVDISGAKVLAEVLRDATRARRATADAPREPPRTRTRRPRGEASVRRAPSR